MHALNKLSYSKLDSKSVGVREGVVFLTYSSLIASSEKGRSRMQQLVQWCGPEYDGLIVFDEVIYFLLLIIHIYDVNTSSVLVLLHIFAAKLL